MLADADLAITYSRSYRLTRALLDPGPGRLRVRGRFTRVTEELSTQDLHRLHNRLEHPEAAGLTIVDPRPGIRMAGAMQNTYSVSLLQAETLAAAAKNDWPIHFLDATAATENFREAVVQLGLTLTTGPP